MQDFQTFENAKLKNKRIFLRADLNLDKKNGKISDTYRLKTILPTIKNILSKKPKYLIIASHWGRPNGKIIQEWKMKPIAQLLKRELNQKIKIATLENIKKESKLILLENLRFYAGEEKNDQKFAKKLSNLADIYINDAFASSHRAHASIVGIPLFLPSFAGPLLAKEINILTHVRDCPKNPSLLIIGGAKIETKLPVIDNLINKYDYILTGGIIGNTIAKLRGQDLKKSFVEDSILDNQEKEKIKNNERILAPQDFVWLNKKALDIGLKTTQKFKKYIKKAKTIVWNGPLGLYEKKPFDKATKEIGKELLKAKAYTVLGGGDTIDSLHNLPIFEKINFVSTGGGAMLEFLAGKELPGLKALNF